MTIPFKTESLELPKDVISEMSQKIQENSVIATLANSQPKLFRNTDYLIFTQEPEAEYVEEGAAKSPSDFGFSPIEGKRHKIQVTVRMTEEVRWADEDNQLDILDQVTASLGRAIGRGLDYGMLHAIQPITGETLSSLQGEALSYVATKVESEGAIPTVAELDGLADHIIESGYVPTGVGFDPKLANALRKMRNTTDGSLARIYPGIGLNLQIGDFDGLRAVTSGNISGDKLAKTKTGITAIMGNWDLIKYGFIRNIALEEILYGDPDGKGDLKRYNQVAYRAEAIFSWANFDPQGGFTVLAPKA